MSLTEHFDLQEFTRHGEPPPEAVETVREFCRLVLEPLRAWVGGPVIITSGYRSPEHNRAIGGAPDSYHVWTSLRCAADVRIPSRPLVGVFGWLRQSGLLFDKIILERSIETGDAQCIHIQYRLTGNRRLAFLGYTHGQGVYTPVPVKERVA